MSNRLRLTSRARSAAGRLKDLSRLTGGLPTAAWILLSIRLNPGGIHTVTYAGKPLRFRREDEQALREVLVAGEYEFLAGPLRDLPAAKVLDLGAHIGTFATWVGSKAPDASIVAVEADPSTYELMVENIRAHRIRGTSLNLAVSSEDNLELRFATDGPSMSHRVSVDGSRSVRSISLATLLESLGGHADIVKMDIEGSEEAAICSEPEVLSRIDRLVLEVHPKLCNANRVRDVVSRYFNRTEEVEGRLSNKPLLNCWKSS